MLQGELEARFRPGDPGQGLESGDRTADQGFAALHVSTVSASSRLQVGKLLDGLDRHLSAGIVGKNRPPIGRAGILGPAGKNSPYSAPSAAWTSAHSRQLAGTLSSSAVTVLRVVGRSLPASWCASMRSRPSSAISSAGETGTAARPLPLPAPGSSR